ncbi:hypothetical protein [Demequina pelophila]|uniref:hypothetical protein n=1 Tax=Demequina pelophila TaxID=1638984 RepID=UPI0007802D9E|nr:hypothetical protein [Demequina pelophila]
MIMHETWAHVLVGLVVAAWATDRALPEGSDLTNEVTGPEFTVGAAISRLPSGATTRTGEALREYLRSYACYEEGVSGPLEAAAVFPGLLDPGNCAAYVLPALCEGEFEFVQQLWMREFIDGVWTDWTIVQNAPGCPTPEQIRAALEREWTSLRPEPTQVTLQPDTGWVYATMPTIAIAEDNPRLHTATVLGAPVEIRATPSSFTWEWGDGESTTTTDPGRPYPNATVTYAYPLWVEQASVVLTTTWTGHYRISGGDWEPFSSTIASASPTIDLDVIRPRAVLVE